MKKTIMVDMDDVMTYGNFSRIVDEYLGYHPDYESTENYYIQDFLGDKKDDFFSMFKDIDMYEDASLLPDCYDVLKRLSEKYEIYICTDYIWPEIIEYAGNNLKNKYNFLYRELDFINPRNYIFVGDKSVVKCDIKIDDKLKNIEGDNMKILFSAWHNRSISEEELKSKKVIRVNNWKEIEGILLNNKDRDNESF